MLGRGAFRPAPGRPALPRAVFVLWLAIGVGATSCALLEDEGSLPPSPTITVLTTPPPTISTTRSPLTTAAPVPQTTTTISSPPTTDPSAERALLYLENLLLSEAGFTELASDITTINDQWENRSRTDISLADAESALEEAARRALVLGDSFVLIDPPPEAVLGEQHRIAEGAVEIMVNTPPQMLEGLRSTDTGQARRAALVSFMTAFDLLREGTARIAAIIGEEGEALLAANRTSPSLPVSEEPEITPTTVPADVPPNPGNTRNCSDFSTHAEAQAWFDTYFPYYGDVAQIDTNNNQVACEALLSPDSG